MEFCNRVMLAGFSHPLRPTQKNRERIAGRMDEEASSEESNGGAYPMCFGVSCAFVALHLMPRPRGLVTERGRRIRVGEMMLRGRAHLLGLLLAKAQGRGEALEEKLHKAELEVVELKLRRAEDAKANEKVVGIFATHEQSWIAERRGLRLQIQALLSELHAVKATHEAAVSDLNKRVDEGEHLARTKSEALEEEAKKRNELEQELQMSEEVAEELRERAKKEAHDHSSELRKHKTAFVELVSSQRQLEAELGRALRQAEAAKQELDEVSQQREEAASMIERLSGEIAKLQKDAGQKDKILSAMLRKSKLDTAERQMLLKEVKISKAKKKQADLDSEKWRSMWESNHKNSPRNLRPGSSEERRPRSQLQSGEYHHKTLLIDCFEAESRKEHESSSTKEESIIATVNYSDHYSSDADADADEHATNDIPQFQRWVRLETERYAAILEERHYAEVEAFTEQLRLKDEKLEASRWQLLSMELESKRIQSRAERLDGILSQSRDENAKLESLSSDREEELRSLKEQLDSFVQHHQDTKQLQLESQHIREPMYRESMLTDVPTASPAEFTPPADHLKDYQTIYVNELSSEEPERSEDSSGDQSQTLIAQSPREEIEGEKEVISMDPVHVRSQNRIQEKTYGAKDSSWKMDIHALGVSYKIRRLKQQLLVLEKVAAAQAATKQPVRRDDAHDASKEREVDRSSQQVKGFQLLISWLNKQVKRYQSIEEKADDLCGRMHESYRTGSSRDARNDRPKEQTEMLESFLEETFRLQRYMVATGQKLMEMQSRISFSFGDDDGFDGSAGFNKRQFADIVRSLFREIQRGLEVRIARVIGDLEGTLASDGILRR